MSSPASQPKCPICGRPTETAFRPFCSKRCADIDLQRWLTGRYAVPAEDDESGPDSALDSGPSDEA
jgi:endogenous inhibitor of DNA gyrase (YacG/DUF329 family)